MSTRQRKRCGGAVDFRQARKQRRLLASSAGGASEAEPIDPGESVVEVIDLTGESSEPEVRDLTDDDSVVHQEQNQQHPLVSRAADNPVVVLTSDDEEESRDIDGAWPVSLFISPFWVDENAEQWQQNQQHPDFYRATDNSAVLLMSGNEEERGAYDDTWPADLFGSLIWVDENSELLEEYEPQRRNVTLRSQRWSDSSVLSSNDEDEATDDEVSVLFRARPAVTIRCPICMDFGSEIVQSERQLVSTACGHIFCSRCLPDALEISSTCPTCRTELSDEQYHPIYI